VWQEQWPSIMRNHQVLKRARLWYRCVDDYVTLRNQQPPVGTALTPDEQQRLFEMAQTGRPGCMRHRDEPQFLLRPTSERNQSAAVA
jgi:hypothetical protein